MHANIRTVNRVDDGAAVSEMFVYFFLLFFIIRLQFIHLINIFNISTNQNFQDFFFCQKQSGLHKVTSMFGYVIYVISQWRDVKRQNSSFSIRNRYVT